MERNRDHRTNAMPTPRVVTVTLLPALILPQALDGCVAVVIDILRATTTIITALAAGAKCVIPCATIDEARALASEERHSPALLAGERHGKPIDGFDLGNSPGDFTAARCRGQTIITTTTNGTKALLASRCAERVLVGAFVNFSAVCEQLDTDPRPVHIVCAGTDGEPALEDTLFAGAIVDHLSEMFDVQVNDAARLAWDCFENHGRIMAGAFEVCRGGEALMKIGLTADLRFAASVDKYALAAEMKYDPPRVEVVAAGIKRRHWPITDPY